MESKPNRCTIRALDTLQTRGTSASSLCTSFFRQGDACAQDEASSSRVDEGGLSEPSSHCRASSEVTRTFAQLDSDTSMGASATAEASEGGKGENQQPSREGPPGLDLRAVFDSTSRLAERGGEMTVSPPVQVSTPVALGSTDVCVRCSVREHDRTVEGCFEERIYKQRHVGGARFLQYIFRRIGQLRRMWVRGGLSGLPLMFRPSIRPRCHFGEVLASDDEFDRQARRARRCLDWYGQWVSLLARLDSGRTPLVIDLFCCAGGSTEGVRRMGGDAVGVDRDDQPAYVARFGEHRFLLSDALDRARLKDLITRFHPIGILSSPPCEGSSTATFAGAPSREARLIAQTREMLRGTGLMFVIENVEGARSELSSEAVKLYGQMFGLRVNRPRLFESGGGMSLHLDAALVEGSALAMRCGAGCVCR